MENKDKKSCYFCGCVLSKNNVHTQRAREHIFKQEWLIRFEYLYTQMSFDHFEGTDKVYTDRQMVANQVLAGSVCEGCNSGWMNKTDKDVEDIFFKVLEDHNLLDRLDASQRLYFARYVLKTALATLSMQKKWASTIRKSLRKAVINDGFIPDGFICLAHYDESMPDKISISLLGESAYTPFTEINGHTGKLSLVPSFKFCIRFKSLLIGCYFIDAEEPTFYFNPDFYKLIYIKGANFKYEKRRYGGEIPKGFKVIPENDFNMHMYASVHKLNILKRLSMDAEKE